MASQLYSDHRISTSLRQLSLADLFYRIDAMSESKEKIVIREFESNHSLRGQRLDLTDILYKPQ